MINLDSQKGEQQFQQPDHQISQLNLKVEQENIFSVRKFLCQPNPLMNKIQFSPYQINCYYNKSLLRLPSCIYDFNAIQIDKNNMNSINQAQFEHAKIKKQIGQLFLKNRYSLANDTLPLSEIDQYYQNKNFLYQRFQNENLKLDSYIKKMQYFASFVLDISEILQKQSKKVKTKENRLISAPRISSYTFRQGQKTHETIPTLMSLNKNQLNIQFNSNFQSGNLFRAYQVNYNQFDLVLQNDINTKGNNQWFYFSIKNVPKNATIKFNLVNMAKKSSLFNIGMKPCVFSMTRYQKRNIGWVRQGQKVIYQKSNKIKKEQTNSPYYQLSFQYNFLYQGDIVYFAHSPPYTYSNLSSYLLKTFSNKKNAKQIKLKELGQTLGLNAVDLIQITNYEVIKQKKKIVWIIARQHPGQVTSGFMLQGLINFLLNSSQQSKYLLNNFVFKIVPIVNVDGVIHGNSRAELIGVDPNRKWNSPNKYHTPIIYQLRNYIQKDKNSIQMFLDLHSHSKKLGTFFYGNSLSQNSAATRIYPLIVCKNDQRFCFKNCRFSGGNNQTARSILFQSIKIPLIYTVESSFFGYQTQNKCIKPYFVKDYQQMGISLMIGLANYSFKKSFRSILSLKQLRYEDFFKQNLEIQQDNQDNSSVGSDDNPNEDQFSQKQISKLVSKANRKKKIIKKLKQLKTQKQVVLQNPEQKVQKVKINTSQSYYKQYFSGRISQVKSENIQLIPLIAQNLKTKNPTLNIGIQVNLKQKTILTKKQSNNQINFSKQTTSIFDKGISNSLCVIGQKVQQISVYGNSVGIQVSEQKQIFIKRSDHSSLSNRKSFNLRTKPTHLQVKQNNFLQRGDFGINQLLNRRYGDFK